MRLINYINEKISKKEQDDALKNDNIWCGIEVEFILKDADDVGTSDELKRQYDDAEYDWNKISNVAEDYIELIKDLENEIDSIQDKINKYIFKLKSEVEEDDDEKVEELREKLQNKEDELEEVRDDPPWNNIDVSDYVYWMDTYEGHGDNFMDLLDYNLPRPRSPEDLGIGGNLDDYWNWREVVEPLVDHMYRSVNFIDRFELGDYGEVKQEKGSNVWAFEYDQTVSPIGGIELKSPPIKLPELIKLLPKLFDLIDDFGYTNSDCGLHIHMSMGEGEMDMTKLIYFVEEEKIYKYFPERINNTYAQSMKNKIRASDARSIRSLVQNHLLVKKPKMKDLDFIQTVKFDALRRIDNQRAEFRHMGGPNYHKKLNEIIKLLGRHSFALSLAFDPQWRLNEYKSRIIRTINKMERGILEYEKNMLETYIKSLKQNKPTFAFNYYNDYMAGYIVWDITNKWDDFSPRIKNLIIKLFERELKKINQRIKQVKVELDDKFYGSPNERLSNRFPTIYKFLDKLYIDDEEFREAHKK